MKKIITFFMGTLLVFTLAACGNKNGGAGSQTTKAQMESSTPQSSAAESTGEPSERQEETLAAAPSETLPEESSGSATEETAGGKTLVVYYSASGNTEEAAGFIAEATDGDLFELIPANPYSNDDLNYRDEDSRVVYEHDHPEERAVELVEATVSGWEAYDTVFIGYPIWWGIAAWPVDGFIAANDFTGKTVIPFCTSASSGLGESGELLKEAAGTGDWKEGVRFPSGVSEDEVRAWVESLGL